jgi:hypothetical protein
MEIGTLPNGEAPTTEHRLTESCRLVGVWWPGRTLSMRHQESSSASRPRLGIQLRLRAVERLPHRYHVAESHGRARRVELHDHPTMVACDLSPQRIESERARRFTVVIAEVGRIGETYPILPQPRPER